MCKMLRENRPSRRLEICLAGREGGGDSNCRCGWCWCRAVEGGWATRQPAPAVGQLKSRALISAGGSFQESAAVVRGSLAAWQGGTAGERDEAANRIWDLSLNGGKCYNAQGGRIKKAPMAQGRGVPVQEVMEPGRRLEVEDERPGTAYQRARRGVQSRARIAGGLVLCFLCCASLCSVAAV